MSKSKLFAFVTDFQITEQDWELLGDAHSMDVQGKLDLLLSILVRWVDQNYAYSTSVPREEVEHTLGLVANRFVQKYGGLPELAVSLELKRLSFPGLYVFPKQDPCSGYDASGCYSSRMVGSR